MLITPAELAKFSGSHKDNDATTASLIEIYIGASQEIITNYLGFDPETETSLSENAMKLIKKVCLEIATLIQMEEKNNIGINSKSFGESGSRSFLNIVDYSKYLIQLNAYKKVK